MDIEKQEKPPKKYQIKSIQFCVILKMKKNKILQLLKKMKMRWSEADKDEDHWKIVYHPDIFQNDDDVASMFSSMVENNELYFCVRFNWKCPNC